MRAALLFPPLSLLAASLSLALPAAPAAAQVVFFDDFDGGASLGTGISGGFSGAGSTTSVQGYTGLGTAGDQFGGDFLINGTPGNPAPSTVLTLSGLPDHDRIDLNFLLAIIDTWDGDGFPPDPQQAPDFFNVRVDGVLVFSESFANAGSTTGQSYEPPPGAELANGVQLGFRVLNVNDFDDAYDMGADPTFQSIPHTASSVTIEWFASGSGWGGGISTDESWAIENVEVEVRGPEALPALGGPGAVLLVLSMAWVARRAARR